MRDTPCRPSSRRVFHRSGKRRKACRFRRSFLAVEGHEWRRSFTNRLTGSTVCRSEEHTSELQSPCNLVCRLLLEKKKENTKSQRCRGDSEVSSTKNSSALFSPVATLASTPPTIFVSAQCVLYQSSIIRSPHRPDP